MPSKIDLSQFGLQQFRSYSRFDNGQEEKLRSALDHHFAIEGLAAPDPRLVKPRTVRLHHRRGVKVLSPNGLPVKCVDRISRWGNPFEIGRDGTREEVIQNTATGFRPV